MPPSTTVVPCTATYVAQRTSNRASTAFGKLTPLSRNLAVNVRRAVIGRPSKLALRTFAFSGPEQSAKPSAVRQGQIRNVVPKDAAALVADGWTLLDVRPPNEIAKAKLEGAVEVPLFVVDDDVSLDNFIKQSTAFGMGGWWLGGSHMKINPNFLADVKSKIPTMSQDGKGVVVVCQKGLRSLSACEQLSRAGYTSLAWINGGLDTARPGDLATVGGKDIRYGGIGGLSEALGWTEVQQEQGGGFAGGYQNILKGFAVLLALDLVWFLWTILQPSGGQ